MCPVCGSRDMHGVQYAYGHPCHYDGVSEWRCSRDGTRVGRWSGFVLTGRQVELPFGGGRINLNVDAEPTDDCGAVVSEVEISGVAR